MEFSEVLNLIISSCPFLSGNEYDGIIIKKLAATNTISDTGASHQSHMAFTGKQKDFFPFLNADGYFNVGYESKDDDLKKYFTLQIPLTIYKENTDALTNKLFNLIDYTSGKKVVKASVLRSRRNSGDDQIELSIKSLDDKDFIEFRKLLRVDDFFVLLKKKNCLEYDLVGIRSNDKNAENLSKCTDFYKLPTQTPVGIDSFETNGNDLLLEIPIETNDSLSESDLAERLASDKELKGTYAIHLFGIKYAKLIQDKNLDKKEIIRLSNIGENYSYELAKGIGIYNLAVDERYLKQTQLNNLEFGNDLLKKDENHIVELKPFSELNYKPLKKEDKIKSYNRIIFGAPGTGKSFQLKTESQQKDSSSPFANVERVTFHPDYSYGQFVGSYKPISDDDGRIRYEYVPGPFMRTLVKALESGKNGESAEKFLLIVEEINRAKVAAVFGDMFQLLDRTDDGESMYEIQASEDVRRYLAKELGGKKDNYTSIKIPNNMYIWATMNSADQGVFPMDTAFKRRWEFTYLGINANDTKISIKNLPVKNPEGELIEWNILRKSINSMLLRECKVNEDKLLGPFFISGDVFKNAKDNEDAFYDAFNSKVLMYLFEDAGKMHQKKLFAGISDKTELTFSKVCEEFRTKGTAIFGSAFQLVK